MVEISERWIRDEIRRVGLRWRQASLDGDEVEQAMFGGMLQSLGDVLSVAGVTSDDQIGAWIDEAKGSDE